MTKEELKEEFVDNVRELLREGKQNPTLSELELKGIKGCYEGLNYRKIFSDSGYTNEHCRRKMSEDFLLIRLT